jgi:hypothetical protein
MEQAINADKNEMETRINERIEMTDRKLDQISGQIVYP